MEEYTKFAIGMAKDAGEIMKKYFGVGMERMEKADTSPVTKADLEINSLLIKKVTELFPGHSVLGEEESNMISGSEYMWVCDPVDGTLPYSLGLPIATFSLGLVKGGEVILGVVYDPFCDRMYRAEKGKGAYLNDKKIHVSDYAILEKAKIEYELWNGSKYNIQPLINELRKRNPFLISYASFTNPSMLLAAGEFTATIFPHINLHDVVTAKIIVEEAGGKVTDIFGNDQRYDGPVNGFIASNGLIHAELVELAKKFVVIQNNV